MALNKVPELRHLLRNTHTHKNDFGADSRREAALMDGKDVGGCVVIGQPVVTVTDSCVCLLAVCIYAGDVCSLSGAAVAGVYRVAGKDMAPLEALVFGVGQTTLSVIISFSRVLATL